MRFFIKNLLNRFCQLLVLPIAATCWVEQKLLGESEIAFSFWAQAISAMPGMPGSFVRRAFYSLTLSKCSLNVQIGFGSIFTQSKAIVEDHVSIGNYAVIGSVRLGEHCKIASRVSIPSGKNQHIKGADGRWTPFDLRRSKQLDIGADVWIGEGAIVMADIGDGSLVAAGAVVTLPVKSNVIVSGNPAIVINEIKIAQANSSSTDI